MNLKNNNIKLRSKYTTLEPCGEHHQLITNKSSNKLIIFFTATGAKPKEFNFWKVGNELSTHYNVLFVNGWCNSWYQDGIRGIGHDLDSTILSIKEWTTKQKVDKIFCTGQSMGGYGSLLIGGLLEATILAFGAETLLDIPHSQYSRKANRTIPIRHRDLKITFKNGLNAVLLAGEEDPVDIYCAQRMLLIPGVTVKTLRYVGHGPAGYLRNRNRLKPLLLNWIEGKNLPEMEEFGTALERKEFPKYFYEGWCELRQKDYSCAISKLKKAVYLYPSCDEARRLLGMAYNGKKMYMEAFEQFSVSCSLNPRVTSLLGLANSLRFMGEYSLSRRAYLKTIKLYPKNAGAFYGLGLCYLKLNNISGALSGFATAAKLAPSNKSYKERLRVTRKL